MTIPTFSRKRTKQVLVLFSLFFLIACALGFVVLNYQKKISYNRSLALSQTTPSVIVSGCDAVVSWVGSPSPNPAFDFYVDVSDTSTFTNFYNRSVSGTINQTYQILLSNDFIQYNGTAPLRLISGQTYYVRVFNDVHSQVASFNVNNCAAPVQAYQTKFGIFYLTWHCDATKVQKTVYNTADILAGSQNWGPLGAWHYWDEPKYGYYCLTDEPNVLRKHAETLRDAGIDFVYVDSTNHPFANDAQAVRATVMIMEPFNKMLEVWNTVPNAPKIVPWAPLPNQGDMVAWLMSRLNAYPNLKFIYLGKPLVIVTDNNHPALLLDQKRFEQYTTNYTIRKMWAVWPPEVPKDKWTFFSGCSNNINFKQSQATIACNQPTSTYNGVNEHVSISTAYQKYVMSDPTGESVPKFQGRTFVKQFETLYNNPTTPIATITGWNEWTAYRFCGDGSLTAGCNENLLNGNKFFVDQYDVEYSRDIEPGENTMGDYYLRLMKECIRLYKIGQKCSDTSVTKPVANQLTIGNFENIASDGNVSGWTLDPDSSTASAKIKYYFDGSYVSGTYGGEVTANSPRPDVNSVLGVTGNHGFTFQIPATYRDGNQHTISLYAVDYNLPTEFSEVSLISSPKTFTIAVAYVPQNKLTAGNFEIVNTDGIAAGWAYDPDTPSVSIKVKYYFDGTSSTGTYGGEVTTTGYRSDVNSAFGITGNHGFSVTIPSSFWDGRQHSIYLYSIDQNQPSIQTDVLIQQSPKTFTLAAASNARTRKIVVAGLDGRTSKVVSGVAQILNSQSNVIAQYPFSTNSLGEALITIDVPVQTVTIRLKIQMYLLNRSGPVDLTSMSVSNVNFNTILGGDLNQDNLVNAVDFSALNQYWFQNNPSLDINQDGLINTVDFSVLNKNWFTLGS